MAKRPNYGFQKQKKEMKKQKKLWLTYLPPENKPDPQVNLMKKTHLIPTQRSRTGIVISLIVDHPVELEKVPSRRSVRIQIVPKMIGQI